MMNLLITLLILAALTGVVVLLLKIGKKKTQTPRLKVDTVFVVFMAFILWTLVTQLWTWVSVLPENVVSLWAWSRVIASSVAIIGTVWLFRVYLTSVKRQGKEGNNKS